MPLNDQQLLFFKLSLFLDKAQSTFGSLLNNSQKVIDPILSDCFLFGVVLES